MALKGIPGPSPRLIPSLQPNLFLPVPSFLQSPCWTFQLLVQPSRLHPPLLVARTFKWRFYCLPVHLAPLFLDILPLWSLHQVLLLLLFLTHILLVGLPDFLAFLRLPIFLSLLVLNLPLKPWVSVGRRARHLLLLPNKLIPLHRLHVLMVSGLALPRALPWLLNVLGRRPPGRLLV